MIIHNFQQGTPEWLSIRLGKFTATNGQAVATQGKGLETLCFEKVAEILTGMPTKEPYTNPDMERGKELEDIARSSFEIKSGKLVKQVGFCELHKYAGCSPDGLIDEDGLIEIKCQNNVNYIRTKYNGKPDSCYIWQMQFQMWVTERKFCEFVVFNENYNQFINYRIDRDENMINKIISGVQVGQAMVESILLKVK
jgi:putative phage-type endonuclease